MGKQSSAARVRPRNSFFIAIDSFGIDLAGSISHPDVTGIGRTAKETLPAEGDGDAARQRADRHFTAGLQYSRARRGMSRHQRVTHAPVPLSLDSNPYLGQPSSYQERHTCMNWARRGDFYSAGACSIMVRMRDRSPEGAG
jgi:hypothetical protein